MGKEDWAVPEAFTEADPTLSSVPPLSVFLHNWVSHYQDVIFGWVLTLSWVPA